jgi:hypothetical protein
MFGRHINKIPIFSFLLMLAATLSVHAQLLDDFGDGEILTNPTWSGNTNAFKVNAAGQLQLDTTGSSTSYLSAPFSFTDSIQWNCWLKLNFSPSDNNHCLLYLLADRANLMDTALNGYFIRMGENGTGDGIDLWKQQGSNKVKLMDGINGHVAKSSNILRIKVLYTPDGKWTVFSDTTGEYKFSVEGSATDTNVVKIAHTGIVCKYTSSNADKFSFDDIYAGDPAKVPVVNPVSHSPGPNDIVINEILYDPNSGGAEFIELYNRSSISFNLAYLTLSSYDSISGQLTDVHSLTSYVLASGAYVVISANTKAVLQNYTSYFPQHFIQTPIPSLNNDGDIIVLSDSSGKMVDKVIYQPSMHFSLIQDTRGVSLERVSENRPSLDYSNWQSAASTAGYATPAYQNSHHFSEQAGSTMTIVPRLFSPDNDGFDDLLQIAYAFDGPSWTGSVFVMDAQGALVKQLVRNAWMGAEGAFSWNGEDEQSRKAPIGMYVIYMEAFNEKGQVKKLRKACALGGKL